MISVEKMVNYWAGWAKHYPIVSIEDGLAENDWDGWKLIQKNLEIKFN